MNSFIILYVPTKASIAYDYIPLFPINQKHRLVVSDNSPHQQGLKRMHPYLPKHMALFLGLHLLRSNSSSPSALRPSPAFLPLIFLSIQNVFGSSFAFQLLGDEPFKIVFKTGGTLELSKVTNYCNQVMNIDYP